MTNKRNRLVVCLALLAGGEMALAQAINPPVAEYRGTKAEGSFEVSNSTEQPLTVVLELKSFKVDDNGQVKYSPLDARVHVQVGASSFIVRPHDTHIVFYKASSTVSPASFSIVPTMLPAGQTTGVKIGYVFPHMIYLYQKTKLDKADVLVALNNGMLQITNHSEKLGRVETIHGPKQDLNGFPLYPGQTREIAVTDNKMTVDFEEGFKVEVQ